MADNEKIAFTVEINGYERAINSFKELKKAKKEAQDAFISGDEKAAKAVAELTDKMEDLNEAANAVKGSGIEKTTASFSLLGQGFKTLDLEKIKTGFKGIGSAMSAIPLLLIVEGITYLVRNFDELSQGTGVLAKILQGVGEIFTWLGDKITEFTDFLDLSNSALDKQGEAIKENADKGKEALSRVTAEYDRQLIVAKANGKSTVEIEKAKQEAIINTAKIAADSVLAYVRAGGLLDEEHRKILSASLETIKGARVAQFVAEKADHKQSQDEYKKHLEKLGEIRRQNDADQKTIDDQVAKNKQKDEDELQKLLVGKKTADREVENIAIQGVDEKYRQINYEAVVADKEKQRQLKAKQVEDDLQNTNTGLEAGANLSNLFFQLKLNNVKKGSAEEEALLKKQFEINKKFQIANALINGAQAVTAILSVPDFTLGIASAIRIVGAVASTALTVSKIAGTQFNGGGGASGAGGTASVSAPSLPSPNVPNLIAPSTQGSTLLDNNGKPIISTPKQQTIKVVNVESESTAVQNNVQRIKTQSLIG